MVRPARFVRTASGTSDGVRSRWSALVLPVIAIAVIAGCGSAENGTPGASPSTDSEVSESTTARADTATSTSSNEPTDTTSASTAPLAQTTTTTPGEASTTTTTMKPPITDGEPSDTPLPAIDIAGTSLSVPAVGGSTPADAVAAELGSALGEPDRDTDWLPMPPKLTCTGNLDYREIQWDDFRIVLERSGTGDVSPFFGWSLGLADIPLVPGELTDWSDGTGITTTGGIGLGDPAADLLATGADNLRRADPTTLQAIGPRVITIETDANDDIVGFGSGRNDCIGGDIAAIPCDRPVPVYRLPDGTPTERPSIDADSAFWAVERIDDPVPDNTVTERLGDVDQGLVENARQGPNQVRSGESVVSPIPTGDPGVGGWTFYVFDDRIDCVRVLSTPFPFELDGAIAYAEALATGFDPQL